MGVSSILLLSQNHKTVIVRLEKISKVIKFNLVTSPGVPWAPPGWGLQTEDIPLILELLSPSCQWLWFVPP